MLLQKSWSSVKLFVAKYLSHSFKKPAFRGVHILFQEPLLATIILRVIHQCNLSTNKTMNNWKEYSMMKEYSSLLQYGSTSVLDRLQEFC